MPSESKMLEKLFFAIYFNDLEKVIEFKTQYPAAYAKKGYFLIENQTSFDLTNLTLFHYKIWFDDDWSEEIMPLIYNIRQRTNQMGDFWRTEGIERDLDSTFTYNRYWDYFYCDDPEDYEEIILEPITTYLAEGFREIDLKLYNRVQCFDFAEVEVLLRQGAKADVHFENDGDSSAFSSVIGAVSFFSVLQDYSGI